MTIDKNAKRRARELAAREGISYAAARRRLSSSPATGLSDPPVLVPIATRPCATDCDGSAHRGAVCRLWRPSDARGAGVDYWLVQAATLCRSRADSMGERYEPKPKYHMSVARPAWFVLGLVYTMLTERRPHLVPDPDRLREAVEAGDLAAVDEVMEPLDRASARLLTKDARRWWGEVKPHLDAYADHVENDEQDAATWEEAQALDDRDRLVQQWRYTWTPRLNPNGYMDPPGTIWSAPKGWLDEHLTGLHGVQPR